MSKALSRLSSREFTRELNKEFLLNCYPIYTIICSLCYDYTSTVHPTLKSSISALCVYYMITMQLICSLISSSQMVNLVSFYFIFHFILFYFHFSIFRTARARVRSDQSTLVIKLGRMK